jgi:hypothetical protein
MQQNFVFACEMCADMHGLLEKGLLEFNLNDF